jgi:hypothetical protein
MINQQKPLKDSENIIYRFVREIRTTWQMIFLICVVSYGFTFLHYLNSYTSPRLLSTFKFIDLLSFIIAIGLAIAIFIQKRKYFSLRILRIYMENLKEMYPALNEKQFTKKLTFSLKKPIQIIWVMGGIIVIIGVLFYWITFQTKNMHIYFIVGVYSLMMNYPRKDLFLDLPYLIQEIFRGRDAGIETGASGSNEA